MDDGGQLILSAPSLVLLHAQEPPALGEAAVEALETEKVPRLKFSATARKASEFRKNQLDFFLRQVELYRLDSEDAAELKPKGVAYLRAAISYSLDQRDDEDPLYLDREAVISLGKEMIKNGSRDPLVWMVHAYALSTRPDHDGRNIGLTADNRPSGMELESSPHRVADEALARFEASKYPKSLAILFHITNNHARDSTDSHPRKSDPDLPVYQSIPDWIDSVRGAPDWQRIAYTTIQRKPYLFGEDDVDAYMKFHKDEDTGDRFLALVEQYAEDKTKFPTCSWRACQRRRGVCRQKQAVYAGVRDASQRRLGRVFSFRQESPIPWDKTLKEDGTPEDRKNKLLHAKQKNVWQMAVAECYSFEELDALSAKTQRDLAVLLATSPDDAVRDGKRANELVEEIGK